MDCSNLGYGAEIDTCEESDLELPFHLLNGMEKFSLLENARMRDCEVVEGASSGVAEVYINAMTLWCLCLGVWLFRTC